MTPAGLEPACPSKASVLKTAVSTIPPRGHCGSIVNDSLLVNGLKSETHKQRNKPVNDAMDAKKTQSDKFKDAARDAEADMTEADFKKVVGKLAKSKKAKTAKPRQ